jgi:hypothetical protein
MALPENRPVDRVYLTSYMADLSTASSAFVTSPVRGYVKKIRGELYNAITVADAVVTAEINGTAITGVSITVANAGSAAGDTYSDEPTSLSTSFVNIGDSLEIVSDGASTTTAPMNWVWEIDPV